ncbi:MAG: VWA domain-containing protein [Bacteroidetes bacterium]|nr:VWA domain-containing protein [Bacteroidota bacterium]
MSVSLDAASSRANPFPHQASLRVLVFLLPVFLLLPAAVLSQPILNFKRVIVNWPTIELYMAVGCDGVQAYSMTKDNFRILENGVEVPPFTLWCPDPSMRCAASLVLVADVSTSMRGSGMAGMKMGLTAYADLMNEKCDQVALVTAGDPPSVLQGMTGQKPALKQAIDGLQASGGSAIYDGAILGLQLMIDSGFNSCRAVILFSDGMDNSSSATVPEIISFANRHRIRVFTIGLGEVINDTELEMIALLTGGRYYRTPNAGQFAAIYQEITTNMFGDNLQECIITYERDCADGLMRTVELQVKDFCGGEDAKTKTYRAPLDSTTFTVQRLRIGEVTSVPREFVTVPLLLDAVPRDATLRPFDITIVSALPGRPLLDVSVPVESSLAGIPLRIDRTTDSVRIRLDEEVAVRKSGTLLELRYFASGVFDSSWFPLGARVRDVGVLCAATAVDSGGIRIVPRLLPRITPEGLVFLCPGGSTELRANVGFVSYRWSTGDTTRSTVVSTAGSYFLDVIDGDGDTLRSDAVEVRLRPKRHVRVEAEGPTTVCRDGRVTFHAAGDTAGVVVRWKGSNWGSPTYTSKAPDDVWAMVEDEFGCRYSTDTVWTAAYDPPVTLNVADTVFVCPGDSVELTVLEEYPFYFWERGFSGSDSVRSVIARADGGWQGQGRYFVYVRDENGCISSWHTVTVKEYPPRTLSFLPAQHLLLCSGGEVEVSAREDFAAYRWSTGATTRTITVRAVTPGITDTLRVEGISAEGCVTRSAPLVVESVGTPRPVITPGRLSALCPNDSVLLDAGEGYAAYLWSTGDSTRRIKVGEEGPYAVEVMAHGGCRGVSDTVFLHRELTDFVPVEYDGLPSLCPGDTLLLEAPVGMVKYRWNTGDTTRTLAVNKAGRYAVVVLSAGGCEGVSDPVQVSTRASEWPNIQRNGLALSVWGHRENIVSYQWLRDGVPIPGANGPEYLVTQTGRHVVEIIDSCGAVKRSSEVNVTTLAAGGRPEAFRVDVYPDPSDGVVHVEMSGISGSVHAELMDLLGRRILRKEWRVDGDLRASIDFRAAPPGMYILRLTHPDGEITRRLTKIR